VVAEIRRIRPGERAAALETIVAAFRRDPQLRWWFPTEDEYEESAPSFFGVLLDTRIDGGEVWVADGGRAIVMWVPPGGNLIGPELAAARYSTMVAALQPAAAERIQRTDEAVDGLLPSGAHWYLGVLACHPDRQGTGLGWAVAAPVLLAADRAGLPVALETSAQANVGYYTRRGFAVIGEVPLADAVRPAGEPAFELVGHGGRPVASVVESLSLGAGGPQPGGPGGPQPGGPGGGITVYVMRREPRG
jgi:GNAT superfamily N-acetyltransferase